MPFVHSRGRDIYFERHGAGPALLLLHGAGSNAATWWQQLPEFSRRFTCLTMDIRCFGRSAAPTQEFTLPHFVDDVLALLDHERVARVRIVGQSLGGMIGLRLALQHADRVAAFVACDSSLAVDHPVLVASVDCRFNSAPAVSIEQRSLGAGFVTRHPELAQLYAQINHFNPSAHSLDGQAWRSALLQLNQPSALTPVQALRGLACPTLFLVGRDDPIVPVQAMRDLALRVEGSELVVVEDAAHSAYFEQPQVFNTTVLDFLARRVPPTA